MAHSGLPGYGIMGAKACVAFDHIGLTGLPRTPSWRFDCVMSNDPSIAAPRSRDRRRFYTAGPTGDDTSEIPIVSPSGSAPIRPSWMGGGMVHGIERRRAMVPQGATDESWGRNIVVCTAVSGGLGLSVLVARLAWEMADLGHDCALVDADFHAGGLDVLLGVEHERGMRFSDVKAPLGRIEGPALREKLVVWEGVRVLPYDAWNGAPPEWWEVEAVLRGLGQAADVVFVDAGSVASLPAGMERVGAVHCVAVELSVLGLARAKTYLARLDLDGLATGMKPMVVGLHPRGASRSRRLLGVDEASDYLGCPVMGPIRHRRGLQYQVLEGLGITRGSRSGRGMATRIAQRVEGMLGADAVAAAGKHRRVVDDVR